MCTPTGEAQPGQLEKEEGGAAIPSTVCLHRCQHRHCTLPLWICGWQCLLFVLCVVCTQVLFYIITSLRIQESQQPGVLWLERGKKKKPSSQKPGDSATMSNVRKSHTDTGKNPPVEIFSWPKRFIYFHITEWSLVYFRYL